MKTILVLNAGSSSLKFLVVAGTKEKLRGQVDQIGGDAHLITTTGRRRRTQAVGAKTMNQALRVMRQTINDHELQPDVIAHRVVHGGGVYDRPTRLTSAVMEKLVALTPLAPVHMPLNLQGIRQSTTFWPAAQQWAVFDTAAFQALPEYAKLYALPRALSQKFHIRKYGFHGISHRWALEQATKKLQKPLAQLNAVTIHLGAGDSIALWHGGKPLDTSMGFTPLEGLTMSTRSGDLDPSIPLFLQKHGYSLTQVEKILEQQSGLFGLTGLKDMRDVLSAAGQPIAGWPRRAWTAAQRQRARLALKMFVYDVQRYLGSYLGQLARVDAIIFTGAIGHNRQIQRMILDLPAARGRNVITIPADEERAIAKALRRVVH